MRQDQRVGLTAMDEGQRHPRRGAESDQPGQQPAARLVEAWNSEPCPSIKSQ